MRILTTGQPHLCLLLTATALLLAGCNIGFEKTPLAPGDGSTDIEDEVDQTTDIPEMDTTDLLLDNGDAEEVDSLDMAEDMGQFSNENCDLLPNEVLQTWECIGAPSCGIGMVITKSGDGAQTPIVICQEDGSLAWHAFTGTNWEDSFTFGNQSDRPLAIGANVAVVRRGPAGDTLEWVLLDPLAPDQPSNTIAFGDPDATRPFAGDLTGDGTPDLGTLSNTGAVAAYDTVAGMLAVDQTVTALADAPGDVVATLANTVGGDTSESLAVIDLEGGEITIWTQGTGVETVDGPLGDNVAIADRTNNDVDELMVCRDGTYEVWSVESGESQSTLPLAIGTTCIPGVERQSLANPQRSVAYLSAAGLLLLSR